MEPLAENMLNIPEIFEAGFYYLALLMAITAVVGISHHYRPWRSRLNDTLALCSVHLIAGITTWHATEYQYTWVYLVAGLGVSLASMHPLRRFYSPVQLFIVGATASYGLGIAWAFWFIEAQQISAITRGLLYAALGFGLLSVPGFAGKLWQQATMLGRRQWRRPHRPLDPTQLTVFPKVSLHVPCYAEPPDVVIETLNALARLDYPNYEVLVIDNNTKDPSLWRPLEAHCAKLGSRFRFFHVDPLAGAKAGAMNFALTVTARDAEIVGAIDADYVAEPDFLRRLVGFFQDPTLGFVQTSHDYRDWDESPYRSACYWEYMPFYKQLLPTLNEWTAGFTVGTMCLVRRTALEEVGGWAEWCLTEDSELGMRLHAFGYTSTVISDTFGRGLIPDTFTDYKKQRFRWTAGPIQQLKKHWRWMLPRPFSGAGQLTAPQKYFEWLHCAGGLSNLSGLFGVLFAPILTAIMVANNDVVVVPHVLWTVMILGIPTGFAFTWLRYKKLGANTKQMILGTLANVSLAHTLDIAVTAGLFSRKPLAWTRTNKFLSMPEGLAALLSAKWEIVRGIVTVGLGCALLPFAQFDRPDVVLLGAIGTIVGGVMYFTAPFMALLAERELKLQATELESQNNIAVLPTNAPRHPAPVVVVENKAA